jgi:hypothetical protein
MTGRAALRVSVARHALREAIAQAEAALRELEALDAEVSDALERVRESERPS